VSTDDVRIGVDIGGTFTDIVTVRDGGVHVTKTPSTPDAPEEGVVNGLEKSREEASFAFGDVGFLSHGTTVATNAVLEGTWADTALVTTEGFRDVLEIARQNRPGIYDFDAEKPAPIVPRDRRFEVPERLDERGNVLDDLDEASVRDLAAEIEATGVDSLAVSLLFAFENDDHEQRVAELLREAGLDVSYSLSSDVLPEIREYERTLTTALNAALKPVMDSYIGNLEAQVRDNDVGAELKIMQSNGGLITADAARGRPVNTVLSGPAGGVQGATYVAERCGVEEIITMDMGGTSCDVSLVQGGQPLVSTDVTVGDYAVGVPMIDIHTVGSGGGSIAWVDEGGALRVGPESAGADPGPISYGRGGTEPTTTDAHLLLGRLDPDRFLSGELDVEVDDVRAAFDERLGDELGMDPQEAAQGVLDVANANMQRALRVVSVERGYDPRDFALVAFGGAGPLHACRLADDLDIPEVIVPQTAGVLSALGLLVSDVLYDYSVSRVRQWSELSPATLRDTFADLHETGDQRLADEAVAPTDRRFERTADLRYVGQSFDISVPVPDGEVDEAALDTVVERFHERHERRYGHADRGEPVELVTLRLRARGLVDTPELAPPTTEGAVEDAVREVRTVTYDGGPHETEIYDRETLPADAAFDGPAVVEGKESTAVVHPGQTAEVDEYGNLVVQTGGGR
jgi:N-methylhydantoinase A